MLKLFDCMSNSKKESTIKESADLFGKANKSITMVAGDPCSSFYTDKRIVNCIENRIKERENIRVTLAYYPDKDSIEHVCGIMAIPKVKIVKLKYKPSRHFAIVDGKHVRLEERHLPGAENTPAIICRNVSLLARDMEEAYSTLVGAK